MHAAICTYACTDVLSQAAPRSVTVPTAADKNTPRVPVSDRNKKRGPESANV